MSITLIAATDVNGVIGNGPHIPWLGKLPKDMKHFRELTLGKMVVMGRKTYDSMGKPLKNRMNIVLTRDTNIVVPYGVIILHSVNEVLQLDHAEVEIMIIGGAEIYALFLPHAQCIELTIIEHEFDGDVYFPHFHGDNIFFPDDQCWGRTTPQEAPHRRRERVRNDVCNILSPISKTAPQYVGRI